jgi:hypothetical protein
LCCIHVTSCRRSSQQQRIDFEHLPELPEGALQRGSRKQTCLVTAATTAPTLLPQDLHYQVILSYLYCLMFVVDLLRQAGLTAETSTAPALLPQDLHYQVCCKHSQNQCLNIVT